MQAGRITTDAVPAAQRTSLVRDSAFNLFNLEVEFAEGLAPASADISFARGEHASVVDVRTSSSVVERTTARARASQGGNLLVYFIRQGGSCFLNPAGEEFETTSGSVVVGSQDAAYKARSAMGRDWSFKVLNVPEGVLRASTPAIRSRGFCVANPIGPMNRLLSSYVSQLCAELPSMRDEDASAALQALDLLLASALAGGGAAAFGAREGQGEGERAIAAHRRKMALDFARASLHLPSLGAGGMAAHLHVSTRQLHRAFEAAGTSVTAEIRALRIERAQSLLRSSPEMSVTEVALSCGFDSLATFYRCFKAAHGVTATEWRRETVR